MYTMSDKNIKYQKLLFHGYRDWRCLYPKVNYKRKKLIAAATTTTKTNTVSMAKH
jgi:hypothetical protein